MYILLPVTTIKRHNLELVENISVQTTHIDVKGIRVRSRSIKGMNTADPTEGVLGNACIEGIGRQSFSAL